MNAGRPLHSLPARLRGGHAKHDGESCGQRTLPLMMRRCSWCSRACWQGCELKALERPRLLPQLERRPEARVLADREIATHTEKRAFALVVGNLIGETQAPVRVGIEPGKSTGG